MSTSEQPNEDKSQKDNLGMYVSQKLSVCKFIVQPFDQAILYVVKL